MMFKSTLKKSVLLLLIFSLLASTSLAQQPVSRCRSITDNIVRQFSNQIADLNKHSITLKCSTSHNKLGIALYFVVHYLPEVNKNEIMVNFDTDTSIFIRRSVQVGRVEIIFALNDSVPTTNIVRTIDLKKHYILAIAINDTNLTMQVDEVGVTSSPSPPVIGYYRKVNFNKFSSNLNSIWFQLSSIT